MRHRLLCALHILDCAETIGGFTSDVGMLSQSVTTMNSLFERRNRHTWSRNDRG